MAGASPGVTLLQLYGGTAAAAPLYLRPWHDILAGELGVERLELDARLEQLFGAEAAVNQGLLFVLFTVPSVDGGRAVDAPALALVGSDAALAVLMYSTQRSSGNRVLAQFATDAASLYFSSSPRRHGSAGFAVASAAAHSGNVGVLWALDSAGFGPASDVALAGLLRVAAHAGRHEVIVFLARLPSLGDDDDDDETQASPLMFDEPLGRLSSLPPGIVREAVIHAPPNTVEATVDALLEAGGSMSGAAHAALHRGDAALTALLVDAGAFDAFADLAAALSPLFDDVAARGDVAAAELLLEAPLLRGGTPAQAALWRAALAKSGGDFMIEMWRVAPPPPALADDVARAVVDSAAATVRHLRLRAGAGGPGVKRARAAKCARCGGWLARAIRGLMLSVTQ